MAVGAVTNNLIGYAPGASGSPLALPNLASLRFAAISVVGSASYTAGGDSIPAGSFFPILDYLIAAQAELQVSAVTAPVATSAVVLAGADGTLKLKVYQASGAEMTAATNLSTLTFNIIAFGF